MATKENVPQVQTPNVPAVAPAFQTAIIKRQNAYLDMVNTQFADHNMEMTGYQKTCLMNAVMAIQGMLDKTGINLADPAAVDQTSLTGIFKQVAALQLNAAALPREVYFTPRNEKRTVGGKEVWVKKFEMGIEGDGNDALLRNFGIGVEQVGSPWLVRENDPFTYPKHDGMNLTNALWEETGVGKVVRVVYPILANNKLQFLIAERDDVRPNLLAHLSNSMMNETFGICADRYKATDAQKKQIDETKKAIMDKAKDMSLEDILDCVSFAAYISPAWREGQSRESMLVRKMRNNAIKKFPKDFKASFVAEQYASTDDAYKDAQDTVDANANKDFIDIGSSDDEVPAAIEEKHVSIETAPPAEWTQGEIG